MSAFSMEIEREAMAWLIQVNDPAFESWDDWDRWMAADARHAESYWRLAEADADVVEALKSTLVRPSVNAGARRTFAFLGRPAIAAAIAAVALGGAWIGWSVRSQPWSIETAPGEQRTVTLADGSRVWLDGATRLTLDRRDPRDVTLDAGRALFEVVHDDRHPFTVDVGDVELTDLGTVFDVTRLGDGARVSVSEGVVRVDQDSASATLNAGDSVLAGPRGLERRTVAPGDVTGWREGRLAYSNETLEVVAQDLERALDRRVRVDPALSGRRFSGSLSTRGTPEGLRGRLSRLLGVAIVEDSEGWRMEP